MEAYEQCSKAAHAGIRRISQLQHDDTHRADRSVQDRDRDRNDFKTHAVYFVKERFASVGPLGRKHKDQCSPKDLRSLRSQERYWDSGEVWTSFFADGAGRLIPCPQKMLSLV